MDCVLRMDKITKVYNNGVVANKEVDFELSEGEIHALVGENGAGKSTLMKVMFGMEKPTSGHIYLRGEEVHMNSAKDALTLGIGMVHQHFMLVPSFTVAQNIFLGMEPEKGLFVDAEEMNKKTEELSKLYNLHVDPRAKVEDITVGMKQKVEILKALVRGAKILILDEPTAVLTPQETELLFSELVYLKGQGHTIVFITHKLKEVKAITDRITVMRSGKSQGVYYTKDVTEQDISNKMVGRDISLKYDKKPVKYGDNKLVVSNLSYRQNKNKYILNNMNFSLRSGEILGIAGVEGNGQSELIKILTRQIASYEGSLSMNGNDVKGTTVKNLRDMKLSYIPEDRIKKGSAGQASIRENLMANIFTSKEYNKGVLLNSKKILSLANELIEKYKVVCNGSEGKINMLSGGNMQKVIVARECSVEPEILIADQPTRGVDIGAAHFIHEKLLDLRDNGCAILLVSADLNEVMELSDSLIVMYEGEIAAYFESTKGITEEELGLYMLGVKKQDSAELGRCMHA